MGDDIVIPIGWFLRIDGLRKDSEDGISVPAPILITERGKDAHRDAEVVTLAWWRDDRWQTVTVDRKIVASARSIVELASHGIPVTSNNSCMLVQYLSDFEAANLENLPLVRVSHKMDGKEKMEAMGFCGAANLITADQIYGPGDAGDGRRVQFRGADTGDDQLADGFKKAGTYDEWLFAIEELQNCPRALLGLYASFVPPMLMVLKSYNHLIDYAGQTTSGKTTLLRRSKRLGQPRRTQCRSRDVDLEQHPHLARASASGLLPSSHHSRRYEKYPIPRRGVEDDLQRGPRTLQGARLG